MKNVFVTGATGNLSAYIIPDLVANGYRVTALVRSPTNLEGCKTVVGSLATIDTLMEHLFDADGIIHLADSRCNEKLPVLRDDITGTSSLLDGWRKGNFVFASTQTVYGAPSGPLDESSPLNPECWYDLGKIFNEFQVGLVSDEFQFERGVGVRLRLALHLGAGDGRNDRPYLSSYLAYIYAQCKRGATFVFDSEEALATYGTSFIGGKDLARVTRASLLLRDGGAYNVSSGFCTWLRVLELIEQLAGLHPRIAIHTSADLSAGECRLPQSRSFLDTMVFTSSTGFEPAQCVEEVVEEFIVHERTRVKQS